MKVAAIVVVAAMMLAAKAGAQTIEDFCQRQSPDDFGGYKRCVQRQLDAYGKSMQWVGEHIPGLADAVMADTAESSGGAYLSLAEMPRTAAALEGAVESGQLAAMILGKCSAEWADGKGGVDYVEVRGCLKRAARMAKREGYDLRGHYPELLGE